MSDAPPRAVVFDCDGLLVDTEACWGVAETELCARHGVAFTAGDAAALVGVAIPAACARIAEHIGDGSDAAQIEGELIEMVWEIVGRRAQAMPGAVALVAAARARVPIAVASNSPRALLDQALARGGLSGAFDATLAVDEVAQPKPAPDLYATACARLRVPAEAAIAFEDSATGIRSAAAAGMRTVGVPAPGGGDIGAQVTVTGLDDPGLVAWVLSWPLR
jgi:HAD superfamily hydrolase (TIGR01509 family)